MNYFNKASRDRLKLAHNSLQELANIVIVEMDFSIVWSYRNKAEQEICFANGFSKAHWLQSPHNYNPSYAIDVMPWPSWGDDYYKQGYLAGLFAMKAKEIGIQIDIGGFFPKSDWPHIQISNWVKLIKQ